MKSAKEEALRLIAQMPEDASMETILAELHFKCRVQRGLEQLERSEVVSHEEAKIRLGRWLKSSGPSTP
jgi:hypothetical protein